MAVPPYVTAGTVIEETWGDQIADSVVNPFASAGARSAAITSPTPGMVSAITAADATNGLEVYNGTNWAKPWNMPWGVVGHYSTTASYSTASTSIAEINSAFRLTIATAGNRRLKFTFSANYQNSSGGGLVEVYNNTTSATVGRVFQQNSTIGDGIQATGNTIAVSSASSTTYTLRYNAITTSTFSLAGNPLQSQFTIEDIGPAGAPV